MPEYRPVPDDREDEWDRIVRYAFQPEAGPPDEDAERDPHQQRLAALGERRGLYEDDDLLVACKNHQFELRVRGEYLDVPGLSAVASPPEHRRQGLVADMIAAALAEYRERDQHLSALWPFKRSFYRRLGWGTANRYTTCELPPEALSFAADAAAGEFRSIGPDDHEAVEPVFEAWLDGYTLAPRRSEAWWRDRMFTSWEGDVYGYAWERDGETRGYLLYQVEDGDGRQLNVNELAYRDHEAYLNLLRFLHNHDSQVETVRLYGPRWDDLLDHLDDPSEADCEVGLGPMARVVDVPAALERLPFPGVDDAAVTLAVTDPLADWNEDTFHVAVADGAATVERTDADPDVEVGVATLSQLYVGYLPVERARRVGDLSVVNPAAAETLAALFPPEDVFLPEGF